MKNTLLILLLFSAAVFSQTDDEKKFMADAARYGLKFKMPVGYQPTPVKPNPDLQYSFAIINADKTMEVRYSIFPLEAMLAEYKKSKTDPNMVMVNPNHLYKSIMQANGLNMTGGQMVNIVDFDAAAVKQEFNADYGGVGLVEAFNCEFGKGYKMAQFVMLHKENIADVMITFLSHDQETHSDLMDIPFHALTF